jgi:CheY-like chemotaxis protein
MRGFRVLVVDDSRAARQVLVTAMTALGAGASAFLSKPVGPEDVSRAVASLLAAPA